MIDFLPLSFPPSRFVPAYHIFARSNPCYFTPHDVLYHVVQRYCRSVNISTFLLAYTAFVNLSFVCTFYFTSKLNMPVITTYQRGADSCSSHPRRATTRAHNADVKHVP
jgi:hypothetical protein